MSTRFLLALFICISSLMSGCNSGTEKQNQNTTTAPAKTDTVVISQGSSTKGIGRFKDVTLTHPLDQDMVRNAQVIYNA